MMTSCYIISAGRPMNVPKITTLLRGLPQIWCVPSDEAGDYKTAGAAHVRRTGGLMESRNWALDDAQGLGNFCLQVSDDLTALRYTDSKENSRRRPLALPTAVNIMQEALAETGTMLAGVAPTDNAFFYNRPYSSNLFIVGDMVLVHPRSTPRFDPSLTLKEDYDFTCQHLAKYGAVVRCNQILASFQHRTNRGGAVAYRTEEREQENIALLKRKWPGKIVDNPRRPNEVLLKWK